MDNDKPINGTLFFISNSILSQHFMLLFICWLSLKKHNLHGFLGNIFDGDHTFIVFHFAHSYGELISSFRCSSAWNCHNCNHQQRKSKNILHIINVFWFYGIEYCTWQNLSIPPNNSLFDCDTNSLRCAHRGIRQSRVAGCRVRPPPYGAVIPYCYAWWTRWTARTETILWCLGHSYTTATTPRERPLRSRTV